MGTAITCTWQTGRVIGLGKISKAQKRSEALPCKSHLIPRYTTFLLNLLGQYRNIKITKNNNMEDIPVVYTIQHPSKLGYFQNTLRK